MDLEKCFPKISGIHILLLSRSPSVSKPACDIRAWSFLARVRFWRSSWPSSNVCIAKNMGHAERDQQMAKRTIYSSKTKWAKSTRPESLFLSPSILFYAKRNETKLIPPMTGRKTNCVVIPRRFTVGHSSLPFLFLLFLLYFSFFFLFFNRSTFIPPRSFPRAQSKDSR